MSGSVRAAPPMPTTASASEFNDLIRMMACILGAARQQLARQQEQLIESPPPGATTAEFELRVKLPDGTEEVLSAHELCPPRRQHITDMIVDLACVVHDVETAGGRRLGLRVLPHAARSKDAQLVRLSFESEDPIRAELRFADHLIRSVPLPRTALPNAEIVAQLWRARLFLIDPTDAAQIRARATPVQPSVRFTDGQVPPPADPEEQWEAAGSASSEPAPQVGNSQDAEQALMLPSRSASPAAPLPAGLPEPCLPQRYDPSRARRAGARYALPALFGLAALGLLGKLGFVPVHYWLSHRQGRGSAAGTLRPAAPHVPYDLAAPGSADRAALTPPADPKLERAAAPDADNRAAAAYRRASSVVAAGPAAGDSLKIRFYYYDTDGVTGIYCDDRPVLMHRSANGQQWSAHVVLTPGSQCAGMGSGQVRVYTYESLAQGKPARHIRFLRP